MLIDLRERVDTNTKPRNYQKRMVEFYQKAALLPPAQNELSSFVEAAVLAGITTDENRAGFAGELGAVMAYVAPEFQSASFREDLDVQAIALATEMAPEVVTQRADFMVSCGRIPTRISAMRNGQARERFERRFGK